MTPHAPRTRTALLVAAALAAGLAGCDSRSDGESETGEGAPQIDANGNVIEGNAEGVPALGAAAELPTPPTFQLFSDETDLETGGTGAAILTATLIDEDRNPVAGETLSWSADGGVLQDVVTTTDENGSASASLRMPQSFRNADVTVTVSAGEGESRSEETITVRAFGTELDVEGLQKSVVAGEELAATITLTAGNGQPIANRPVSVVSALGNQITPAEPVTDENGVATVLIGSAAGSDTITVGALDDPSLSQEFAFNVSADRLEFSAGAEGATFDVDAPGEIRVRWTSGGAPVAFRPLRVSTTAGQLNSASQLVTDADGFITVPISSSAAGEATVTVEDLDGDPVSDIPVSFVATAPALLDVGTSSTRVYVDGSSQVSAVVRDVNGNPVAGEEVSFASPNLNGGQISPASAVTNAEGRATTTFRAGSIATESDAIEIIARTTGSPVLSDSVRLSAVERRLNVSIGRGAGLFEDGLKTQNWKNMVVQVADGSGAPLSDAQVTLSITPIEYYKGIMTPVDGDGVPKPVVGPGSTPEEQADADAWSPDHYAVYPYAVCAAEDDNLNRSLDRGEDENENGRLDPQDPATLAPIADPGELATLDANGTLVTGDDGSGYFRMVYPKGNANWALVRVTARASHLGTEAQDSLLTSMGSMAADVVYADNTPPNLRSPYGREPICTDPN